MSYEIKINPLDLNPDVGIGLLLDLTTPTGKLFDVSYTTLEQARTNFINLLLTNEGERIMQPLFGCNLRKILFDQVDASTKGKLDRIIREKTNFWLPYLNITKMEIELEPDTNRINFDIILTLKDNEFDTISVTFSINLT